MGLDIENMVEVIPVFESRVCHRPSGEIRGILRAIVTENLLEMLTQNFRNRIPECASTACGTW